MSTVESFLKRKNLFYTYSSLANYNLLQFTTTRRGGISKDNYESMNTCLYSDDDVIDVMENRRLLAGYLGIDVSNLYIPHQVHEDNVRLIDSHFLTLTEEEKERQLSGIDALITQEKNICIGVTTADCVPLLIYDPANHALGAIHAGWKSTVQRIGAKAARRMVEEFGSQFDQLKVTIGPSISQEMFEVGDEVGDAFEEEDFDLNAISFRNKQTGKLHIDLWKANAEQLIEIGIRKENIEIAGICTFQNENYFSARRQTISSGRMLTGGVLK